LTLLTFPTSTQIMSPTLSFASIILHGVGCALILSLIALPSVAGAARKVGLPQIPEEPVVDPEAKPTHFWYNTELGESSWENPLPIRHEDDEGNVYYQDPKNHSSVWWADAAPFEYAWKEVLATEGEHKGQKYYHNKVTSEAIWDPPAIMAWKKMSSEKVFYYNQVTGASQRERPHAMGFYSDEHSRTYWVDKEGNPTWESDNWWTEVPVEGEEGKVYYYNEVTKASTWEKPEALGWVLWHEEL